MSRRRAHVVRSLIPILVGVFAVASHAAQSVDRAKPPAVETAAGGFTAARLPGPVAIDGRAWISVTPITGTQTVRAPNGRFTLSLGTPNDVGDLERYRLTFAEPGGTPVILQDAVSYVFVTSDWRWIVFEPTLRSFDDVRHPAVRRPDGDLGGWTTADRPAPRMRVRLSKRG